MVLLGGPGDPNVDFGLWRERQISLGLFGGFGLAWHFGHHDHASFLGLMTRGVILGAGAPHFKKCQQVE